MSRGPGDFKRVKATPEEVEQWRKDELRRRLAGSINREAVRAITEPRLARQLPDTYRVECLWCGKRIWGSGLGMGSHRRACKGRH